MKMNINRLPAVLLAVITTAIIVLAAGMFNQVYAADNYSVEVTPRLLQYTCLPGEEIDLAATVYNTFEDGEKIQEQDGIEYKWKLDASDLQFANIVVNTHAPSLAKVKFKSMPAKQTEIEAYVKATCTAYSNGQKLGSNYVYLCVDSDYYELYPTVMYDYIAPKDTYTDNEFVLHYNLLHPEGELVDNVTFTWDIYEEADAEVTPKTATGSEVEFTVKRKTGKDVYLGLEAKWKEGTETKYEYSDFLLKNIPDDLNSYMVTVPEEYGEWVYYVDEEYEIPQENIRSGMYVNYENHYLKDEDYDMVVYKYGGYNTSTGEPIWKEYTQPLKVDPRGSAPDPSGDPTEGRGIFKIVARAKAGSGYKGETDDFAQYIYLYSNKSVSGYAPTILFPPDYATLFDDEPYIRYDVEEGTILEPIVKIDETELTENVDYTPVYVKNSTQAEYNSFPTAAGLYSFFVVGKGDYYGTSDKLDIKVGKTNSDFKLKGKTVKVRPKKKKTTFKASKVIKVSGKKGKVTYKKVSGNKKIKVASNGKVTVKKGLKKGKTYKVKVKVTDNESENYFAISKTVTFKVKVKKK